MDSKKRKNESDVSDSKSNGEKQIAIPGGSGQKPVDSDEFESDSDVLIEEEISESEPDSESEDHEDSSIVVPAEKRRRAICGFFQMPTCLPEPIEKKLKMCEDVYFSKNYSSTEFIVEFQRNWMGKSAYVDGSLELINDPFRICVIDDFLEETFVLNEARKEFYEIDWNKRNMDLYEFFQSKDLVDCEHKYIKIIYNFLKTDVMSWVSDLTNLTLNKMSATCSVYTKTDYLLVHDDLQEDRAIAFVLYLTDPSINSNKELWTPDMGGALQLLNKDTNGHPNVPVKDIIPKNNRLIFFKVTNDSYHQVAEVLSMDHCRMSINGWFHTPTPELCKAPTYEPPATGIFSLERLKALDVQVDLEKWISHQYLEDVTKVQIQNQIENESEISLPKYFNLDIYTDLCRALSSEGIIWESVGPPNRRKYEVMSPASLPDLVTEFLNVFRSKKMFSLLKDYTDLDLEQKENTQPTLRYELQRWSPGCYSLLSEYDWKNENELDLIMYLSCPSTQPIVGGRTMYISTDENIEDALVTLEPLDNTLNVVFRDTARITKHVSKSSCVDYFYMFVCSYKE